MTIPDRRPTMPPLSPDTRDDPGIRREVPLDVPEPLRSVTLVDGQPHALVGTIGAARLRELPGLEVSTPENLGGRALVEREMPAGPVVWLEVVTHASGLSLRSPALAPGSTVEGAWFLSAVETGAV